jgi:hypothetical protein
MTFKVQDNRSETPNQRPQPESLLDGQTAINYHNTSPGLFFRTDSGALVKAGPIAIGSTAPQLAGWTAYSVGEMWLDTTSNIIKVWNGVNWVSTSAASAVTFVPPTSIAGLPSGAIWNNNGNVQLVP